MPFLPVNPSIDSLGLGSAATHSATDFDAAGAATSAVSGYGPGGAAGNPRKQWVDVRDFGVSTDTVGSGNDTAGIQAALASLSNGPGTVYLPRRALTSGFGVYWLSAPGN